MIDDRGQAQGRLVVEAQVTKKTLYLFRWYFTTEGLRLGANVGDRVRSILLLSLCNKGRVLRVKFNSQQLKLHNTQVFPVFHVPPQKHQRSAK